MNRLFATLVSLSAIAACSAAAQTSEYSTPLDASASPAVECGIRETSTRHGVRFEALVWGEGAVAGEYEFILTKDDRGGSSDIAQSGEFDLSADPSGALGETELSLERGARYRARLVLWDVHGEICRAERRS
jgi:hypothetical protein